MFSYYYFYLHKHMFQGVSLYLGYLTYTIAPFSHRKLISFCIFKYYKNISLITLIPIETFIMVTCVYMIINHTQLFKYKEIITA